MFTLLLFIVSICLVGIIFFVFATANTSFELVIPAGSILGLAMFVFTLNLVAFFFKGSLGIIISYMIFLVLGVSILFYTNRLIVLKIRSFSLNPQKQKFLNYKLLFWAISLFGWGGFVIWKTMYALIGSDINLYYAIAHSFIRGNFPFKTPWQPDIPLSYHTGVSLLLGTAYFFSGLDFKFLHLLFSALFIFFTIQIIIWLFTKKYNLINFFISNLSVALTFISFGFIYIVWPIFPLNFPTINNFHQLFMWIRNLPTVNQSIEVYGAPINLDALIYFIFHAFGLAVFFSLIALIINYKKEKFFIDLLIICITLASLALINESLFIAVFPAIFVGIFLIEKREKTLIKNLKILLVLIFSTLFIVSVQGGMISSILDFSSTIEKSAIIFPKKEQIRENFIGYHYGQESSKLLADKNKWLPFRWFHLGIDILLPLSLVIIILLKNKFYSSLLTWMLFTGGVVSLIAYNVIVPKFLIANGNRFLSTSFLLFSLIFCFYLSKLFEKIKGQFIKVILYVFFVIWIFIPSLLPPLLLLSKNRFGENQLIPKNIQPSEGILWLRQNINYNQSVMVLDKNSPHPSGQARALVDAGVFAPVFYGNFRVFTIEASPEYFDISYFLSPQALEQLKVSILLIDVTFFENLPNLRKEQLKNDNYFKKIFDNSDKRSNWERIYVINKKYFQAGGEIGGTFIQLKRLSLDGKIYIDNEENFTPSFLRRALIFSLRGKNLYFNPESGIYLNVETDIPFSKPTVSGKYDYLILSKDTDPQKICQCNANQIWSGFWNSVYIWHLVYNL